MSLDWKNGAERLTVSEQYPWYKPAWSSRALNDDHSYMMSVKHILHLADSYALQVKVTCSLGTIRGCSFDFDTLSEEFDTFKDMLLVLNCLKTRGAGPNDLVNNNLDLTWLSMTLPDRERPLHTTLAALIVPYHRQRLRGRGWTHRRKLFSFRIAELGAADHQERHAPHQEPPGAPRTASDHLYIFKTVHRVVPLIEGVQFRAVTELILDSTCYGCPRIASKGR